MRKEISVKLHEALRQTILDAGIKRPEKLDIEIVDYSPADERENIKIYEKANETWLCNVEEKDPGKCVHITGEMRALSDPLHRQVCRRLWEKYKSRCSMAFYLPLEYESNARGILSRNRQNWKGVSWSNHMDVFDLLSEGIVNLYFSRQAEAIHYSVFGNEYVLLQAKHEHGQHVKEVWLIRSEPLNEVLSIQAKRTIIKSKYMQPTLSGDLMMSVSGPLALHILISLSEKGNMSKDELFLKISASETFRDNCLRDLENFGFVEQSDADLQLTSDGAKYLSIFDQ